MVHYNTVRTHQVQEDDSDFITPPVEEEITIPSHSRSDISHKQRVECIKCHKPAILYRTGRVGKVQIIYEHRDEPPIADFVYKGKQMHRYRRCSGGYRQDGLEVLQYSGIEEEIEEKEVVDVDVDDPPASDTFVRLVRKGEDDNNNISKDQNTKPQKHRRVHSPSMREIGQRLNVIRDEQRKMYKEIHAIRSIMEMMIRGDVGLTVKSLEQTHGHGIS